MRVDASDVVQKTFLKAHREFRQFLGSSEPELTAWLRQIWCGLWPIRPGIIAARGGITSGKSRWRFCSIDRARATRQPWRRRYRR